MENFQCFILDVYETFHSHKLIYIFKYNLCVNCVFHIICYKWWLNKYFKVYIYFIDALLLVELRNLLRSGQWLSNIKSTSFNLVPKLSDILYNQHINKRYDCSTFNNTKKFLSHCRYRTKNTSNYTLTNWYQKHKTFNEN